MPQYGIGLASIKVTEIDGKEVILLKYRNKENVSAKLGSDDHSLVDSLQDLGVDDSETGTNTEYLGSAIPRSVN